jgi:GTP cyclohydrolase I
MMDDMEDLDAGLRRITTRPMVVQAVADLLRALEIDDPHTERTPDRVASMWHEVLAGYHEDPAVHLERTFPAPADPGLIIVAGIRVQSTCAHHLLPITGYATVAYRPHPGDRVVGLSKLARLFTGYARRLQVQERLGHQVASALEERLRPEGAACVITAEHGCMAHRGVMLPGTVTTTVAMAGDWTGDHPDGQTVLAEHARTS